MLDYKNDFTPTSKSRKLLQQKHNWAIEIRYEMMWKIDQIEVRFLVLKSYPICKLFGRHLNFVFCNFDCLFLCINSIRSFDRLFSTK